ncbi:hypothetical protein LguiB_018051 [Lonicera macranthoides]
MESSQLQLRISRLLFVCSKCLDAKLKANSPSDRIDNLTGLASLVLDSNELLGYIPPTLRRLKNLKGLYLEHNELKGSIPNDLCRLKRMANLYFSDNKLNGPIPSRLGELGLMRRLFLYSNKLTLIIPSTLWSLKDLLEGIVSTKGDVYSYGVLLMETLTRKKPTDEMFSDEMTMRSWVYEASFCSIVQVVDANLIGIKGENVSAKKRMLLINLTFGLGLFNGISYREDQHGRFTLLCSCDVAPSVVKVIEGLAHTDFPFFKVAKVNSIERYFFSFRDRTYTTGHHVNRATKSGYWKVSGKDRTVVDPRSGGSSINNRLEPLIGGLKNRLVLLFTSSTVIGADSHRENRFSASEREIDEGLSLPINSNRPLRISEPSEWVNIGVTTAQVPVAIPLFRGHGEAVPVLDEETDRPSIADLAVEELFEEADCPPLRRRSQRRSPLPPSSPQFSETEDMAGRRSVLDLMNSKIYKASASTVAGASRILASPPLKRRRLVQIGSFSEGIETPSAAENDQGGVVEVPPPLVNVEAQESLGVKDLFGSPTRLESANISDSD